MFSDFLDEPNETVVLKFGTPVGGGNLKSSSFTYTIADDDKPPYLYLATANTSLSEVNKSKSIVVRVSSLSANDVYVPINFGGRAERGVDYNVSGLSWYDLSGLSSLQLKIPAGKKEASFTIKTLDDSRYEGSESIVVAIGKSPVNASLSSTKSDLTRTLTITDNESPPPKTSPLPGTLALDPNVGGSIAPSTQGSAGGIPINSPTTSNISGSLAINNGLLDDAYFFFDANFNGVQDFLDLNANGVRDEGDLDEPAAASLGNGLGNFEIDVRFDLNRDLLITPDEGRWVAVGGVDTSTGLPSRMPFAAPLGMYTVTPLSTLQEPLVRLHGFTVIGAEARLREALQVEGETLAITSLPHAIIAGDVRAAAIYSQLVQLSNVTLAIAELFAGAPAALPLEFFAEHAYRAVADRMAAPDATLDLTYEAVIADLIATVTRETGVTLHDETSTAEAIAQGAATILSQGNLAIAALPPAGSATFLTVLTRIKKVIQGDATAALRSVAAGQSNVAQVVAEYTGANLQGRIAAASIGSLPRPSLVVSDATVVEGDNGNSILEFNVEMIGDHIAPVTVDFTTIDDEQNPGGGSYIPTNGTLTWAAGDVTPRTLQVLVQGDDVFELNERVLLRLMAATNAVVINEVGYGQVINDDVLAIDLPDGGPNTAHIELGSELLVLVNDEFVHIGPLAARLEAHVSGNDNVADALTVEFSAETSAGQAIVFTAGGGAAEDAMRLLGGNFHTIVHSFQVASNGSTALQVVDGDVTSTVQWQGLETASLGFNDAGELTFEFSPAVTSVILEDADPTDADPALAGKMRIRSATQQFSPVVFHSSIGALTIRGGLSTGDVVIESTDPSFVAAVRVTLLGDYDGDGQVDGDDLAVWKSNFGQAVSSGSIPGDGDSDGDVDGSDFLLWQRNLGSSSNLMANSSPATAPAGAGDSALTLELAPATSTPAQASYAGWLTPLATKPAASSTLSRAAHRPRPTVQPQYTFSNPALALTTWSWRAESAVRALCHVQAEAEAEADPYYEQIDRAFDELQLL